MDIKKLYIQSSLLFVIIYTYSLNINDEVSKTEHLLELYKQKLSILQQIKDKYPEQFIKYQQQQQTNNHKLMDNIQLGHGPKMELYPLNWYINGKAIFVPPQLVVVSGQLYNLHNQKMDIKVDGDILNIDRYQITSKTNNTINILKLRQHQKSLKKLQIPTHIQYPTKWHKAVQFQDKLLQWHNNILYLLQENNKKTYTFKSEIINIFSLNQYKIIYVTRYKYGILNVRTFQIVHQSQFGTIVQNAIRSNNLVFVLLKNYTINVIAQEKIIYRQAITSEIVRENITLEYLPSYLFMYSAVSPCFQVFDVDLQILNIVHFKKICLPGNYSSSLQYQFLMDFFMINDTYRLMVSVKNNTGKQDWESFQYQLFLPFKQVPQQTTIPWKMMIIIFAIIIIVYFRSKKSQNTSQIPKANQNLNKKERYNEIEQYLAKNKIKNMQKMKSEHND